VRNLYTEVTLTDRGKENYMKDLLDQIRALRKEATQEEVDQLIAILGDTTSIPVLEIVLSHYKAKEKAILEGDLLEWMRENDLEKFENEDVKVNIATYVSAKVANPDGAFSWLESHEYGDLIKDTLDFPKGEFNADVEYALGQLGASYTKKSGIHPQSLKKIMSDRLKSGEDLPSEDDGIALNFYDLCVVKGK
jgi:hypothetical protein